MAKEKEEKKYKAIIFDLDGTLIDSLPYHYLAFKDMLLEHGIKVNKNYLKKMIGLATNIILRDFKKRYSFSEDINDLREERRYHYFKFVGTRDITFPGVKKTIKKLKKKYKIGIATGSSMITFSHSTDKNFQELFETVVTIMDTKRGKPHADPLLLCAKRLKVNPSDCLMIGDSNYDALAARAAKMDFIGVTTGFSSGKELRELGATHIIKSIKELSKIV
jgi:HAD superfamily hydrolase (TIGR01549 family)